MDQKANRPESEMSTLEKKIYGMADEVLDILKQLSQDNKHQLNSKVIAERMFVRDSVKKMLSEPAQEQTKSKKESNFIRDIADTVLSRFSELTPYSITSQFSQSSDTPSDKSIIEDTTHWLDSTIKMIKKYYDSVSERNKELEEFIRQAMKYLGETERHLASELSSHQQKFSDDRSFEKSISTSMDMIVSDFNTGSNIQDIRTAVLGKIESINKGIEHKRKQDVQRLKYTETTLKAMSNRITEIKKEANEVKKKAEEIERESLRDSLTDLYNRKAYDMKIRETLASIRRHDVQSSLLVCDIDNFKKINDTFGHKVGDLALKKLANLFKEKLRVNDFISRYGGEEFAIILTHTDITGSLRAAEGLISYINKSVFSYKERKIPLTISIGVCMLKKTDDTSTVFERADAALYLAKQSGKNTVKTEEDLIKEDSTLKASIIHT